MLWSVISLLLTNDIDMQVSLAILAIIFPLNELLDRYDAPERSNPKQSVASVDTIDLGPIPTFVAIVKWATIRNNSADSIEVRLAEGNNYSGVIMGLHDDGPLLLGPNESKQVIVGAMGLSAYIPNMTGRLFYMDVFTPGNLEDTLETIIQKLRWSDVQEDIADITREFPLQSDAIMCVPYGGKIGVFIGFPQARFGETIQLRSIESDDIRITDLAICDSGSGQISTSTALPIIARPGELTSVKMDALDSTTAYGYLMVSTAGKSTLLEGLARYPIIPESPSAVLSEKIPGLEITQNSDGVVSASAPRFSNPKFTVFDVKGLLVHQTKESLHWQPASGSQVYFVSVEGMISNQMVRQVEKIRTR